MNNEEERSIFGSLWHQAFRKPLQGIRRGFSLYVGTVVRIHNPKRLLEKEYEGEKFMSPVNFLIRTFEYLLVIIILRKSFGTEAIGADDELFQRFSEVMTLISIWLSAVVFLGFGRVWRAIFRIKSPKITVDSFLLYEFSFIFFVSYLLESTVLSFAGTGDDEAVGIAVIVLWSHFVYYFFRFSRTLKLNMALNVISSLIAGTVGFSVAFVTLAFTIGILAAVAQ
ncbi:MAG: hypothetical protein AAF740_05195 [Bacteroidota bacterium]